MRRPLLAVGAALVAAATLPTGFVGAETRGVSASHARASTRNLQFVYEAGGPGTGGPGELAAGADGVAVDSDGNPWVTDSGANRIVKYDYNGNFIAALGGPAGGGGTFSDPQGIAADSAGFLYIADSGNNRVVKIDTGGDYVRSFGRTGPLGDRLVCPCYDAVDGKGTLYVTEAGGLVEYGPDGSFVKKITKVDVPRYVSVNSADGDIYVTDGTGGNIVHMSSGGVVKGTVKAATGSANGLAFDATIKELYFSDFGESIVREYEPDLKFTQNLGQSGLMFGQMNGPTGVALDCRGNLYVVDGGTVPLGSKLMKFVDPSSTPPPCAPPPIPGALDTQINDVEITQGTQPTRAYTATDAPGGRTRAYGVGTNEVPLRATTTLNSAVRNPTTVVRVYANLRSGPPAGVGGIPATLSITPGTGCGPPTPSTIEPDAGPAVLKVGNTTVDTPQRTDPAGAYTFTLPRSWTDCAQLGLTARVNPAGINCDKACQDRSTFHLTGIRFSATPVVDLHPIALLVNGQYPAIGNFSLQADPARAFGPALSVTPYEINVWGWATQIDVSDIAGSTSWKVEKCFLGISLGILCSDKTYTPADGQDFRDAVEGELMNRIDDYINDNYNYKVATHTGWVRNSHLYYGLLSNQGRSGVLAGDTRGDLFEQADLFTPPTDWVPRLYAVLTRPLTSMAHELNHALGREHASDCAGGGENGQKAEGWPPDEQGYLDGIGLDTRPGSGGFRGPYKIIAPGLPAGPMQVYDFMSYCAGESDAWISPKGWDEVIRYHTGVAASGVRRGLATRAAAKRLEVLSMTALQFGDGTLAMTNVSPQIGYESNGDPSSPYRLEARDAAGNILASVAVDAKPLHVHSDAGLLLITGSIRRVPGTAQLVLRRGTDTATRRERSAHPPTVKLLTPLRGTLRGRRIQVRWRASDADHDPLTAQVDYSPDGGRSWNPVWVGSSQGHSSVPLTLLKASRNARLRVRVDDGFDDATGVSGRIVVPGAPPAVVIDSPVPSERILAGAPVYLSGLANGDEGVPIAGGALRWFDGRRPLGHGSSLSVTGLAAGRHTIRLQAREGNRVGSATAHILIRGTKPEFLVLSVPAQAARSARSVRLRVATTVAATLSVSGQRFAVGPKVKAITVRVKAGSSTLVLVLRAGGLTTKQTISIHRG